MTTFRLPFNGRNLAGMDSQVLRPIITEFHWDVWGEEGEGDKEEEEDGGGWGEVEEEGGEPVVAKHHRTESKKQ